MEVFSDGRSHSRSSWSLQMWSVLSVDTVLTFPEPSGPA